MTEPPIRPVLQLRVALTSRDYERLMRFYCAGLGLEPTQVWTQNGGHGLMLELGQGTLELFDEGYAGYIDGLEAGTRVSGQVRLALEVPDLQAALERLLAHGATVVHPPVLTPWGDDNVRVQDPDGLQVTLFQARGSADTPAMHVLFTLGYQGHTIASFLEVLLAHGITTVIDVRERPYSRKPDFSKKRLMAHLAAEGIAYLHLVELGTPKPIRDAVRRSKDYPAFFTAVTPLVEAQEAALQTALVRARAETCALLCYEGPVTECHRLVVAEALERRAGSDLHVVHL